MIDQQFSLNCRHHHPIFLALLLLTIASIPVFSFGVVQLVPIEHLGIFAPHPATTEIFFARYCTYCPISTLIKFGELIDFILQKKPRELSHCKTGEVNCNGYSCMRVANNFQETLTVEVKGYLSSIDSGKFCTWRSRHPVPNKLVLKTVRGFVIFDGEIRGDKSVIVGRDGQKYDTKDGKIWMAEDGSYP